MLKIATSVALIAASVTTGGIARAQTPIPPSPQDFVLAAAQSDQYEIMAGHLAEVQGQDPRIKTFAQQMIRDHMQMTQEVRQAAMASKLQPPPAALSSDQALLLSGLQSLRGAEFDKAYARQQVLAHTQATAVEESFADAGTDANLKKAAQSALSTIQGHLNMAQQLRNQLGGT